MITFRKELITNKDRTIVTPYAFSVSPALIGTPLASPSRRLFAISLDLLFIVFLSTLDAFLLTLAITIGLYGLGFRKTTKTWLRMLLGFSLLFLALITFGLGYLFWTEDTSETDISVISALDVGKHLIKMEVCDDVNCRLDYIPDVEKSLTEITDTPEEAYQGMTEILAGLDISEGDREILRNASRLITEFEASEVFANYQQSDKPLDVVVVDTSKLTDDEDPKGLLSWILATLEEFGLGFGWAAAYFSFATAWGKGRTLGKYIMGIRVVLLSGKTPNLWESFGRYGGYGAGFSTGLTGFLQVYWDSNRQAIQDKISETLVVNERKAASSPQLGSA